MIRWLSLVVVGTGLALSACSTTGDPPEPTVPTTASTTGPSSTTTSSSTTTTTTEPVDLTLTPQGIAGIEIGMALADVQATGLVGEFAPGCPLVDPPPLSAPIEGVEGTVEVLDGEVRSITVTGAGTVTAPGGVAPGDQVDTATAAWEGAGLEVSVDKTGEEMFGVWFLTVLQDGEPAFGTTVDPVSGALGPISVPRVFTCE